MALQLGRYPSPTDLAKTLRQLADRLEDEGDRALVAARLLAERGWPPSTNGSDGGRSSDTTSSTERAALHPGMYDLIDVRLRTGLANVHAQTLFVHNVLDQVVTHKCRHADCHICADWTRPGAGKCSRCGRICKGRHDGDRLKATFCPSCHRQWLREHQPPKDEFRRGYNDGIAV